MTNAANVTALFANIAAMIPPERNAQPPALDLSKQTVSVDGRQVQFVNPASTKTGEMVDWLKAKYDAREKKIEQAVKTVAAGAPNYADGKGADLLSAGVEANFKKVGSVDNSEKTGFAALQEFVGKNRGLITEAQGQRFLSQVNATWGDGMFAAKGDGRNQRGEANQDVKDLRKMIKGWQAEIGNSTEYKGATAALNEAKSLLGIYQGQQAGDLSSIVGLTRALLDYKPPTVSVSNNAKVEREEALPPAQPQQRANNLASLNLSLKLSA